MPRPTSTTARVIERSMNCVDVSVSVARPAATAVKDWSKSFGPVDTRAPIVVDLTIVSNDAANVLPLILFHCCSVPLPRSSELPHADTDSRRLSQPASTRPSTLVQSALAGRSTGPRDAGSTGISPSFVNQPAAPKADPRPRRRPPATSADPRPFDPASAATDAKAGPPVRDLSAMTPPSASDPKTSPSAPRPTSTPAIASGGTRVHVTQP